MSRAKTVADVQQILVSFIWIVELCCSVKIVASNNGDQEMSYSLKFRIVGWVECTFDSDWVHLTTS